MKKLRISLALLVSGLVVAAGASVCVWGWREHRRRALRRKGNHRRNRLIDDGFSHLHYDKSLSARCENGIFVGRLDGEVIAFKGIPYARQPIGSLRWKAPLPPHPDRRVFSAFHFAPVSLQTEREQEYASFHRQSEACLYLNVWTHRDSKKTDKPVMVFIHGGSYAWGGTSNPIYDGRRLVEAHPDIVLVTIGYRLGLMGFVDFSSVPGGEAYPDAPNLGLLDQVQALRWVQGNIRAFGGNPDCVTLFGESAGGGSVSLLAVMPEAKGLFQRVIVQSGSLALSHAREECRLFTRKLLEHTGCTTMKQLSRVSTRRLRHANRHLTLYNAFPQRDGRLLPLDLYEAYRRGETAHLDLLIGTNEDEARYWIQELGGYYVYRFLLPLVYRRSCERLSESDRQRLRLFFDTLPMEEVWKKTEFYNEVIFRLPAIAQAERHASAGGRAFMYRWTFPSGLPRLKACHAVELAYVFGNLHETLFTGNNIDRRLAARVQQMWVNFARTGNPSLDDCEWPPYLPDTRATMRLDASLNIENDPLSFSRRLLMPLLKYRFGALLSRH